MQLFELLHIQNILMQLDEATDPWGIKVSKVEVFYSLVNTCLFAHFLVFVGERRSTASRIAESDGSRSRGSSGSASQGLKMNNHSSNQLNMASDCHVLHITDCPSCQVLQKIR